MLASSPDGADYQLADADRVDAGVLAGHADDTYDIVIAEAVLQDLPEPSPAPGNWVRVLRPGGWLRLTLPTGDATAGDRWRFTMQEPGGGGRVNLLELLQIYSHAVAIESVQATGGDDGGAALLAAELRKRRRPLTPVQSHESPTAKLLEGLAKTALAARRRWRDMDEFHAILASGVREATVVDLGRLYLLYQWLLTTLRLPGDCIEVGSFRGGTAKLISEVLLRRRIGARLHLFDTFAGMPDRLAADEAGLKGTFAGTSPAQVRRLVGNNPGLELHPGTFPESLPAGFASAKFRFAHVDVDIEQSVEDCLKFIYPRLVAGGVMVIDDYGHPECPGATRAVERFFADKPEMVVQMPLACSAVVVKSAAARPAAGGERRSLPRILDDAAVPPESAN